MVTQTVPCRILQQLMAEPDVFGSSKEDRNKQTMMYYVLHDLQLTHNHFGSGNLSPNDGKKFRYICAESGTHGSNVCPFAKLLPFEASSSKQREFFSAPLEPYSYLCRCFWMRNSRFGYVRTAASDDMENPEWFYIRRAAPCATLDPDEPHNPVNSLQQQTAELISLELTGYAGEGKHRLQSAPVDDAITVVKCEQLAYDGSTTPLILPCQTAIESSASFDLLRAMYDPCHVSWCESAAPPNPEPARPHTYSWPWAAAVDASPNRKRARDADLAVSAAPLNGNWDDLLDNADNIPQDELQSIQNAICKEITETNTLLKTIENHLRLLRQSRGAAP